MGFFDRILKPRAPRNLQSNAPPMSEQQRALFELMSAMQSMGEGVDADEMPGGIGEFGISPDNPIPCQTIVGSMAYLANLRAEDGSKVTAERQGSHNSKVSGSPVDCYLIRHADGRELAKIFISPYQGRVSRKAPRGFRLA